MNELKGGKDLIRRTFTSNELRLLQEALTSDLKTGDVRLREGEYQYDLAKAVASFQLELRFPDVKEITRKLYGEEKSNDIQFIRKVQTILKKMEKSRVVKILPKSQPWELQRYAVTSFKFQDADKNLVILATDEQRNQARNLLQVALNEQGAQTAEPSRLRVEITALAFIVVISYVVVLWSLLQSSVNPIAFVSAFSVAAFSSVILGKTLSRNQH